MTKERLSLCLLIVGFTTIAGAQQYTVTDLGAIPGFSSSLAYDNNGGGGITGCSDNSILPTLPCQGGIAADAFLWTNGSMEDLGHLPGDDFSVGYVVNDSGVVVGYSASTTSGVAHGFVWDGGMVDLGTLPGGSSYSIAAAITNKAGVIAGESVVSNGDVHVVLWTKDSGGMYHIQDQGHLPKAPYTYAYDINQKIQVTGVAYFFNNNNKYHAFLWSKATGWQDLPGLAAGSNSYGSWLNNSGTIAGASTSKKYPNGVSVYWDTAGKIHSIGTLPGGTSSSAGYISDTGTITGQSTIAGGVNHAYIWIQGKKMQDLNDLIPKNSGWVLNHAAAINKLGQIVGYGVINGVEHGFLLTP